MVIETLFNALFIALESMLSFFPDIEWDVHSDLFDTFFDVLQMVCYLLPMPTVVAILGIVVGLTMFRIVVSFVKTIWDLLPIV